MPATPYHGLSKELLQTILDNIYNEVYVTDANLMILHAGAAVKRHYGLTPEEMIGHSHNEFSGIYWYPSVLPMAYKEKRRSCIEHMTITGEKIVTVSTPVLDGRGNIKMVVSVVQENVNHLDMDLSNVADGEHLLMRRNRVRQAVDMVTKSEKMAGLLSLSTRSAKSDIPILIQGASGTGKTMLARYIHENSLRRNAPFLSINCASIPENLLESELFGYLPYAFTGAGSTGKQGLLKLADGGTVFLDEIGELPLSLQSKILTVVEQHRYLPVGGTESECVNVRVLSATNRNLEEMTVQRQFREDLFWRLNVVDIRLPSLVERPEDILPLANYYLNYFNQKYKTDRSFSPQVLDAFQLYHWPGNVRQLKNTIDRAFVVSSAPELTLDDLPEVLLSAIRPALTPSLSTGLEARLEEMERDYVQSMFRKAGSSRKLAAALGVSQTKANQLIQKYCSDNS